MAVSYSQKSFVGLPSFPVEMYPLPPMENRTPLSLAVPPKFVFDAQRLEEAEAVVVTDIIFEY